MVQYQQGEALAQKCLTANGFQVIDRRSDPSYWKKDIDFTAIKGDRREEIEVKWDSKISRSGALFFELLTDIQSNSPGWATYTEADYIFYGDAQRKLFYIFPVGAMRQYLREHREEYETRIANDYDRRTGAIRKQSLGAIVPLARFQQAVRVDVLDIQRRLGPVGGGLTERAAPPIIKAEKVEKPY